MCYVDKKSNATLSKLEVSAEAEKPVDSPKLTGVNMKFYLEGKTIEEKLEALWRRTEANRPVVFVSRDPISVMTELETKSTS